MNKGLRQPAKGWKLKVRSEKLEIVKILDIKGEMRYNKIMKEIRFTYHAKMKFEILKRHNFVALEDDVKGVILKPEKIEFGRKGRKIAQKIISKRHILRVIYEEKDKWIEVITFYPARRKRYED